MDYSERMLRREIEQLPDGVYEAEGTLDGFVDHPDPALQRPADQGRGDDRRDPRSRRPDRHLAAGRPADQHAARGHGRHRDLGDAPLDPARRGDARPGADELRPVPADHDHGARGLPRQPDLPRADDRALLRRQHRRRHARCGRSRRVVPERVSAGVGNLKVVAYSGLLGDGRHWVYMDIRKGATAAATARTASTPSTRSTRTRATTRSRTSSRTSRCGVTRYELVEDGAGAGRWRGGLGIDPRDRVPRADAGYSLEGDGSVCAPPGLFGGGDGTRGRRDPEPRRRRRARASVEVPLPEVGGRRRGCA